MKEEMSDSHLAFSYLLGPGEKLILFRKGENKENKQQQQNPAPNGPF